MGHGNEVIVTVIKNREHDYTNLSKSDQVYKLKIKIRYSVNLAVDKSKKYYLN